jgi:LysM repeat protein
MKVLMHRIILLGSMGLLVMAAGTACTLTGAGAAPLTPAGMGDFTIPATPTEDMGFLPTPIVGNTPDVFGDMTSTSEPFGVIPTQEGTGFETPGGLIPMETPTPLVMGTEAASGVEPFAPLATATPFGVIPTVAATSTPAPVVSSNCPTTYTVQSGDTLFRIALQFGITYQELAAANGITNPDSISIGVVLNIPCGGAAPSAGSGAQPAAGDTVAANGDILHTVQPGENLFRIALKYGLKWEDVAAYNGITNPNNISVGQVIHIPQN